LRRLWLLLRIVAVLAALAFLAASYLGSDDAARRAREFAVAAASEILGEDVEIREVRLASLWPPAVELLEVSIHSRDPEREGLPLAAIDRVEVVVGDDLDLRARFVPLEAITVLRPRARIALIGGKLRDYQALQRLLAEPRPAPSKPVRVHLELVDVIDAAVRTSVDPLGLGIATSGIDLAFVRDARGDGSGRLGVETIEVVLGVLRERAVLRPGNFTIQDGIVRLSDYELDLRSGVVALAGEVHLPAKEGAAAGRPFRYSMSAEADISLSALREAFPRGPNITGDAEVRVSASGEGASPTVAFDVQTHDVRIQGKDRLILKPGFEPTRWFLLGDASLRGTLAGDTLTITRSSLAYGGGEIGLEATLVLRDELPWHADFDLRDVHLEEILAANSLVHAWVQMGIRGTASMSGRIKGGFEGRGQADFDFTDLIVWDKGWDRTEPKKKMLHVPRGTIRSGLYASTKRFVLEPATIRGPSGTVLTNRTEFGFTTKPITLDVKVFGTEFYTADLGDEVAGQHVEGRGGLQAHVRGLTNDLDISGSLEWDDFVFRDWAFGTVTGDFHWHARKDLEFTSMRGRRGETNFEAEARVLFADKRWGGERERIEIVLEAVVPDGHGRFEDILPIFFGDRVTIRGEGGGQVRVSGPPRALNGWGSATGRDLTWLGEEFATADIVAHVRDGRLTIDELWARKESGNGVFARGSIEKGGIVDVEFRLPDIGIEELSSIRRLFPVTDRMLQRAQARGVAPPDAVLTGRLHGDVVLGGTFEDLRLRGHLTTEDTRYRGETIGDTSLDVGISDRVVTAELRLLDGRVRGSADMKLDGIWPYHYRLAAEQLSLDRFLPESLLDQVEPVHAGLSGVLEATGTLKDRFHEVVVTLDELFLERGRHRIEAAADDPIVARYSLGAIRLDRVRLVGPEGRTNLRAEGSVRLDGPVDLRVSGPVNIAFADLAADVLDRAEAKDFSIDLSVRGPSRAALDVAGALTIRDGLLRTIYFPHPISVAHARVSLADHRVYFDYLEGELGGGPLEGVGGSTILLDDHTFKPREYDLHVTCRDCTLRYPSWLPPTRATVRLTFRGIPPDGLTLGGRVDIDELVWRDTVNYQRSILPSLGRGAVGALAEEAGEKSLFALDIGVYSREGVLRMANNIGDFRGTLDPSRGLRIVGAVEDPRIEGLLRIDGGSLRYKGKDFELEPSTAEFRGGPRWYPYIDLAMWTDIPTRTDTYRVSYYVTGPLNGLKFTSSSDPFLAEKDINSLLLFGLTEEQLAASNVAGLTSAALAAGLGLYAEAGAASLGDQVGAETRALLPDRLEIVPVYTDTTGSTSLWVVITKEAVPGLVTLEGGVGLGGRTTGSVGRIKVRFLRDLFLEGSWVRNDAATTDFGNFSLDLKFELNLD
jgi:hypothetical protein